MGAKGFNSGRKVSVVLVDDHPVVREGFSQLINRQNDFQVLGQASGAADARKVVANLKPDLVVLDLALRGVEGFDFIRSLLELDKNLSILVLSANDEMLYAERALRAGAKGYVMKHSSVAEIMNAMRKAAEGRRYLSSNMQEILMDRLAAGAENLSRPGIERLSDREMQVFKLIATGQNTREIAERLSLSIKTIETYRANIKEKLKLRNAIDLVRAAVAMSAEHA